MEEGLALRNHVRMVRKRPDIENFALFAMTKPEGGPVAEQGAGDRGKQDPPELQLAAGHQRAERKNDGRAGNDGADDRNRLQQRRQKQRQIGEPRMGRDKGNQWIDQ